MITPAGTMMNIAGGVSINGYLGDGGPATESKLYGPHGIALDGKGSLYIADSYNNRIRRITPDGMISTFIGDGTAHSTGDGGLASGAGINRPWDVKVASDGTVFFTEYYGGRVRAVSPGGIVSTVGTVNGYAYGIALDRSGNIIVTGSTQIWLSLPQASARYSRGVATASQAMAAPVYWPS